jgi:hypothetical protein
MYREVWFLEIIFHHAGRLEQERQAIKGRF